MILSSMMPTGTVDCGTTSSYNNQWRYGSAECRELNTISSLLPAIQAQHPYRITQIKETGFRRGKDGLFAVIEGVYCYRLIRAKVNMLASVGYPTSDVSSDISLRLPHIILSEIDETSHEISAHYLKYSILNANKLLGKVGHFSAASIAICHIYQVV